MMRKKRKVVMPNDIEMPYKTLRGLQEHIIMVMCACANGDWMHPLLMFSFKNSIQSCAELIEVYHASGTLFEPYPTCSDISR